LIAKAPLLSPQQSDIDRALIRFKEWKPIGETGWYWFRVFLFGFFAGKKGIPYEGGLPEKRFGNDKRAEWVTKNKESLIGLANEWKSEEYRSLLELEGGPGGKKETFQRLAALFEHRRLLNEYDSLQDWSKVKSGHPVNFDASANGYQHLSMLLQNEKLAKSVNVIKSEDGGRGDIYQEVADRCNDNWEMGKSALNNYLKYLKEKVNADIDPKKVRSLILTRRIQNSLRDQHL
jgi:Mitochondrial DNA-directed RNA polymerase